MIRWLLIVLVVFAGWYGWTQQDRWRGRGSDELVFRNHTGQALERMKVRVGSTSWAIERLAIDTTVKLPVRCEDDGPFELEWKVRGREGDKLWQGGDFRRGPIRMRHRFELLTGDGVVWSSERMPPKNSVQR